jgi:hypothetical protein
MYIRVAILATQPHIAEHRLDVALRTGNRLVHPQERISGLIVIEFRNGSYRFPPARCMTVLTGNV